MVAGCGPAFIDLTDIERADAGELARMAERIGVDPAEFSAGRGGAEAGQEARARRLDPHPRVRPPGQGHHAQVACGPPMRGRREDARPHGERPPRRRQVPGQGHPAEPWRVLPHGRAHIRRTQSGDATHMSADTWARCTDD
jgi:hypothetical protein